MENIENLDSQQTETTAQNALSSQQNNATPEAIADALMNALDSRNKRVETGIVKSMAEQYGMTDAEIAQILEAEKAKRAAQLPPEQQRIIDQQIQKANNLLISAETKSIGASMGLLDADAALLLMNRENVRIDAEGTVSGVKESLETLQKEKPYLFKKPGAWGASLENGMPHRETSGVEAAFSKLNPEIKLK
jgi:hypothetical protein|nr:MAG TPA: minor structural protein [Caudoviricetes sp.]